MSVVCRRSPSFTVVVVPETFAIDERHDAGIPADDEPDAAADAVADPQDSPLAE